MPKGAFYHPHPLGSTQARFEDQAELSMEEVTAENELKLFPSRQLKMVTQGSGGLVWKRGSSESMWWYLTPLGPSRQNFSSMLTPLAESNFF